MILYFADSDLTANMKLYVCTSIKIMDIGALPRKNISSSTITVVSCMLR